MNIKSHKLRYSSKMKDLSSLSNQEIEDFFNSFDTVLCDVHGVLWNIGEPIPGAPKGVRLFQKLGKRFTIVSNSTSTTLEDFPQVFKSAGFDIPKENIVIPTLVIISYLQKINFDKKIFLMGTLALKMSLEGAGFQVVQSEPVPRNCSVEEFLKASFSVDDDIGAVISEGDFSVDYVSLQNAIALLKRPEMVFIKGVSDERLCLEGNFIIIGPGCFHKILENISGREAISVAKPSSLMNDCILEKFQIRDPTRVLFIGDSIEADMAFATKFGYKKLLVFSGVDKKECLEEWKFPKEYKPEFYVGSLGDLVKM